MQFGCGRCSSDVVGGVTRWCGVTYSEVYWGVCDMYVYVVCVRVCVMCMCDSVYDVRVLCVVGTYAYARCVWRVHDQVMACV